MGVWPGTANAGVAIAFSPSHPTPSFAPPLPGLSRETPPVLSRSPPATHDSSAKSAPPHTTPPPPRQFSEVCFITGVRQTWSRHAKEPAGAVGRLFALSREVSDAFNQFMVSVFGDYRCTPFTFFLPPPSILSLTLPLLLLLLLLLVLLLLLLAPGSCCSCCSCSCSIRSPSPLLLRSNRAPHPGNVRSQPRPEATCSRQARMASSTSTVLGAKGTAFSIARPRPSVSKTVPYLAPSLSGSPSPRPIRQPWPSYGTSHTPRHAALLTNYRLPACTAGPAGTQLGYASHLATNH